MDEEPKLPQPTTVADVYLAAILEEIRALRRERPVPPETVRVKEPEKSKPRK